MTGLPTIGDHRWEGCTLDELIELVRQVGRGPGAVAMNHAMDALRTAVQAITDLDTTLRSELAKLGVEWQSRTGEQAQATMAQSADYASAADPQLSSSAMAVDMQGESHSLTKHSLPDPKALNYDHRYQESFGDKASHFFGYETDHDEQVKQANAAKAVVVQQMNTYTESSRTNLAAYQPLAAPPAMNLRTQPVAATPAGSGAQGLIFGQPGSVSNSGGSIGGDFGAVSGTLGATSGTPGGGGTPDGGGTPGGGGTPDGGDGLREGGRTGIGPNPGSTGVPAGGGGDTGLPGRPGRGLDVAAGAGIGLSLGAGVGAGATALIEERGEERGGLGRGRAGAAADVGRQGSGGGSGPEPGGVTGVSATAEERVSRSAMPTTSASASRGPSAMMRAAAPSKATDEEDGAHIRKYGVESADVFDDNRLVMPTVIGKTDPTVVGKTDPAVVEKTEARQQRTEHQ